MVFIYRFCKKESLIQPPGEPREYPLGKGRQEKFELHKISQIQNYRNGQYTLSYFLNTSKKVKNEVKGPEKLRVWQISLKT